VAVCDDNSADGSERFIKMSNPKIWEGWLFLLIWSFAYLCDIIIALSSFGLIRSSLGFSFYHRENSRGLKAFNDLMMGNCRK
jgi:hypothetical protein